MKERILVVDDTMSARELVRVILNAAGYEIVAAESGPAALAAFDAESFDLVLLDVMMPGMDGFEVCRRIRERDPEGNVPVVFLTALDDHDTHQAALSVGADDFLVKPVRRPELLIRVRSMMRIRTLNAAQRLQLSTIRDQHDQLARANKQRELFMNMIVHDMKNMLQTVISHAELVELMGVTDVQSASLTAIVQASSDLARMQHNLLDTARNEEGSLSIFPERVELRALINDVAGGMGAFAGQLGSSIQAEAVDQDLTMEADPDLIRRTVENLVHNALSHAGKAGHVSIGATAEGHDILLWVDDDGPGVPMDQRDVIFDLYSRLEPATDGQPAQKPRGHHGLGLASCRVAAQAHGGTIAVTDSPAGGARFLVRLPAVAGS